MPKTTRSYPVSRKVLLTENEAQAIDAYATRHGISANKALREMLDRGIGIAAATDGAATVQEMMRAAIREELRGPLAHIAATAERAAAAAETTWDHFRPREGERYYEPNKYGGGW